MADKPAFNPNGDYNKPKFDPSAPIGAAQVSSEQAQIAALPNANAQAASQAVNNTPLGANPSHISDQVAALDAAQTSNPNHNHFEKLAPLVGGAGLASLGESALAKVGGAAIGGAGGDAAAQLTTTGKVDPSQSLAAGATMAAGEGIGQTVLSPLAKWISTTKAGGGKLLQAAAEKAATQPVELSPETNKLAEQIMAQGKRGNGNVKVVSDLMARLGTNPNAPVGAGEGPLLYPEARDFQSNASRLSASESMDAKGNLKSLVAQFSKSFGADVQSAADQAGVGDIHRAGMQQYATAASKGKAVDTAKDLLTHQALKGAAQAGGAVAGGGAAYDILQKFGVVHWPK